MSKKQFNLYVEGSGENDYVNTDGVSQFFVLAGLWVSADVAAEIEKRIQKLGGECFGAEFPDKLYQLVLDIDCTLFAVIVDKLRVLAEKYPTTWPPLEIAYECLLQRVEMQMADRRRSGRTAVNVGNSAQGHECNEFLCRLHQRLLADGSRMQPNVLFKHIHNQVSFAADRSNGSLELAALVASDVHRHLCKSGADWDANPDILPTDEPLHRFAPKFCRSRMGNVPGWGIIICPAHMKMSPESGQFVETATRPCST